MGVWVVQFKMYILVGRCLLWALYLQLATVFTLGEGRLCLPWAGKLKSHVSSSEPTNQYLCVYLGVRELK